MAIIAGADGCRSGWITLILDTDTRRIGSKIFASAADLIHHLGDLAVIAIDIPIGLSDDSARLCDVAARKRLGPKRGSSVFPAPIRPLIERLRESSEERHVVTSDGVFTYRDACELNEMITGRKISKQAWQIYPKILELDDLITDDATLARKVIEVHPEVSFAAWAGAPIIEPKRKPDGFERRLSLVSEHYGPNAFDCVRHRYRRADVANDDILDAFATIWTAERVLNGSAQRLPDAPPRDARGLPMQIVY